MDSAFGSRETSRRRNADLDGEVAFEVFYRDYFDRLVSACRKWGLGGAAEDVAQETLIRAFERRQQLDFSRPMWPWLRTVASNLVTDLAKRERRQIPTEPGALPDAIENPADVEERIVVSQALSRLPGRQRLAVSLRYLEGREPEEAGRLLGVNRIAFNRLLFRARQGFEAAYRRVGGTAWGLVTLPLRSLRRLGEAFVERAKRMGASSGHAEYLLSATAQHYATAAVALLVALGGPSTSAVSTAQPPAPAEQAHDYEGRNLPPSQTNRRDGIPEGDAPGGAPAASESGSADGGGPQQAVDDITRPNHDVTQPEDARITSIARSPGFSEDQTFLASGTTSCRGTLCPSVLFRSTDAGRSWVRLEGRDFFGVSLLLPPEYGASDRRIFAMGPTGLQVSEDGGRTFLLAAVAGANQAVGSAAISPAFNNGDPTILIGAQTLMRYRDDLRTIEAVPSTAVPGPLEPAFSPAYPDDRRIVVGGIRFDPRLGKAAATLFTCTDAICSSTAVSPDEETPRVRLTPRYSRTGIVHAFTSQGVFASADWGQTFNEVRTPGARDAVLWDLAVDGAANRIYAAVGGVRPAPHPDFGLYVSNDGGGNWERARSPLLANGANLVVASRRTLLVGLGEAGIACSLDGGRTWARRCR